MLLKRLVRPIVAFIFSVSMVGAEPVETFYSVKDFEAKGDGKTLDTGAIQSAINEASENGGGTVYFPAGTYFSGTIFMKDDITLYFDSGATLLGSDNEEDYPQMRPSLRSYTENYVNQSLIVGEGLSNIGIRGQGTIDGNGSEFQWKEYENRPYVIRFIDCQNILIENINLKNSPMWMQHYLACEKIRIRGITVDNHVTYNNDGLDLDSCVDVVVSDCIISSDDDALCLKSTTSIPCENITITNSVLSSHCNAFKMGTESNGGFKNITFSNSTITSPNELESMYGEDRGLAGIALEIVDGGEMEGISISNITMKGITTPIFLRLGNRARPFSEEAPKPGMGQMRNITISNIVATEASKIGCSITGLPNHPIQNVSLSNINLTFDGGGSTEDAEKEVPERPEAYPESTMFGVLPAYGFYVRHVEGLRFENVELKWNETDRRPAVMLDDVKKLHISDMTGQSHEDGIAMMVFRDVISAIIRGCRATENTEVFLRAEGKTDEIYLFANDFTRAKKTFIYGEGVSKTAIYQTANKFR